MPKKILTIPNISNIAPEEATIQAQLVTIFLLSFSSGLPFLLILSTLSIWLVEAGISKTEIGIFAWITIPYTLKFLWAPIIDKVKIPLLYSWFGQRRSWLLLSQLLLIIAILILSYTKPELNIFTTAMAAFAVGFCSAIQDIVVEAYRIEILAPAKMGIGASCSVLGYRVGMLFSGAGAIYIAAYTNSWVIAYNAMAYCVFIGIIATLYAKEPAVLYLYNKCHNEGKWFTTVILQPFKTFVLNSHWKTIIIFILCYKFADTILNVMSMPFLLELGFNKIEIANVAKTFGIFAMIGGGLIGGLCLEYFGLRKLLLVAVGLQFCAGCLFMLQSVIGYNIIVLFLTMGIENFTCGLAQIALMAYLSSLCVRPYTAMHYAMLTSFASLVRVNFSMLAGWLADNFSWLNFYFIVCCSCILSVMILLSYSKHFLHINEKVT